MVEEADDDVDFIPSDDLVEPELAGAKADLEQIWRTPRRRVCVDCAADGG